MFILHFFRFEKVFALFGTSWPMLLPVTFISLYKSTFARVFRREKVLALFVTSWPMLFVPTFISLHKVHFARVSRHEKVLALFCYLMADVIRCNIYLIA